MSPDWPFGPPSIILVAPMTPDEKHWNAFRRWGYLQADLDVLGRLKPMSHPDLDEAGPEAASARAAYCGPIGVEFAHMPFADRVAWIAERMEGAAPEPDAVSNTVTLYGGSSPASSQLPSPAACTRMARPPATLSAAAGSAPGK